MFKKATALMVSLAFISTGSLNAQSSGNPLAADRWTGAYQNSELKVELAKNGGQYVGTVIFNGNTLPLTAILKDNFLEGVFSTAGQKFTFRAEREGDALTFVTDGARYVLQKRGANTATTPPNPESTTPERTAAASRTGSLVGDWISPKFAIHIGADGTAMIAGTTCRYTVRNNVLTLTGVDGKFDLPFELNGDTLTLTYAGQVSQFTRGTQQQAAGGSHPELAGKWCLQSNVNATNGGASSSSICIVLNANGTYVYHGESDSYNPYGGVTSQSDDTGTWTATQNTLAVNSRAHGPLTYPMEKRNHPKTGDPMLILGGKTFVTYYQKAPWR